MGASLEEAGPARAIHLITPEYPPAPGGVAAHTRILADGLRERGLRVVVWSPAGHGGIEDVRSGSVRPLMGRLLPGDLLAVGRKILAEGGTVLLQWVPHGYGMHSLNLPFCLWIWYLSRKHVPVYLMAHELFVAFTGTWRQKTAAVIHHLMLAILVRAASRIWASSGHYCRLLGRFMSKPRERPRLMPSFSNIPVHEDPVQVSALCSKYLDSENPRQVMVGHFSTMGPNIRSQLEGCLLNIHQQDRGIQFLFMGSGSTSFFDGIRATRPDLAERCIPTGFLSEREVSLHLQCCNLLLQPCPSGLNTRHGSVMAGLEHGLPVASFRSWRTEALWNEPDALVLARAGDVDGLCRKILELLESPDRLRHVGSKGRALYDRHCSADLVLDRFAQALGV